MGATPFSIATYLPKENFTLQNGIYVSNKIKLSRNLYRYLPYQYLLDLLGTKELHVSNRQLYDDLNEHGFVKDFKKSFGPTPILRNKKLQERNRIATALQRKIAFSCCISCWTYDISYETGKTSENYLMWEHYSKAPPEQEGTENIGIRITTTCLDLINSIQNQDKEFVMGEISYEKEDNREHFVEKELFFKRDFYQDEREVRICVFDFSDHFRVSINPEKLIKEITLSPFVPKAIRNEIRDELYTKYPWLQDKILDSQIFTTNNL